MELAVRRCSRHCRISSEIFCTAFFEIAGLKLQKSFPWRFTAARGRNVNPRKSNFSFG